MSNPSNTSQEDRFVEALHTSARAWRLMLHKRLRHLGLCQSSWQAIVLLAKAAEPLSQRELADLVGIEGPSMVAMLDRLERDGVVVRTPSTSDRRIKLVRLTDAGSKVCAAVYQEGRAIRTSLLDGMDPQGLAATTALLETFQWRIAQAA